MIVVAHLRRHVHQGCGPCDGAGATQTLTIAPVPTGGTLEGVDILCGTEGIGLFAPIIPTA